MSEGDRWAGDDRTLIDEITRLKRERDAVILAHNYQVPEVQDIADMVGDSLALSQRAASVANKVIVLCGVHFMAESAAILAPEKVVLLPAEEAGCPMADMVTPETLRAKKAEYPGAAVVCYVNSSAAVKAESDICCTSSNAVKVVNSVSSKQILFVPDRNLGHYVASHAVNKEIILWEGYCLTHHRVRPDDVVRARAQHPEALVVVHPECQPEVVALADYVGSTSQILAFARSTPCEKLIIGTEMGILHRLKAENPGKQFFLLASGLVCPNMKFTTLQRIVDALHELRPRITVSEDVRDKAGIALERMLAVS